MCVGGDNSLNGPGEDAVSLEVCDLTELNSEGPTGGGQFTGLPETGGSGDAIQGCQMAVSVNDPLCCLPVLSHGP